MKQKNSGGKLLKFSYFDYQSMFHDFDYIYLHYTSKRIEIFSQYVIASEKSL